MERRVYGKVIFLSRNKTPETIDPEFMDSNLFFCFTEKEIRADLYDEVVIPMDVNGVDVFLDDSDGKVYLTNFVYLEDLLNIPIDSIIVCDREIQVLVGTKCLNFFPSKLPDTFSSEGFIYKLFGLPIPAGTTENSSRSARKFVESQDIFGDDDEGSVELGVYTNPHDSTSSSSAEPLGIQIESISESDESISAVLPSRDVSSPQLTVSIINVKKPKKIVPTGYDKKCARKDELEKFKGMIDGVLLTDRVKSYEISVPTDKLVPSTDYALSDMVIQRMAKELESRSCLVETDPIVVLEKEDSFLVISGNRKVAAYQAAMKKAVHVSRISESDHYKYLLQNFFLNKSNKDGDIGFLLIILEHLLKSVSLPKATVRAWSSKERNYVFMSLFGPMTTIRHLLDVYIVDDLSNGVKFQLENGVVFSNHLLRDLVRKFNYNPAAVKSIMSSKWSSRADLQKEIKATTEDVVFVMIDKGITSDIAQELTNIYKDDPLFADFVRGTDLRYINKASQKDIVIKKFEVFKAQKLKDRKRAHPTTPITVELGRTDSNFDLLLTSDRNVALTVMQQKESVFIIHFGSENISDNISLLLLPDQLASEDEFGQLINHMNVSFAVKQNGSFLSGVSFSDYCRQFGIVNKSVYTISQLREFSNSLKTVFADVGDILREELILNIISEGATIIVKTMKNKRNILTFMKSLRIRIYPQSPLFWIELDCFVGPDYMKWSMNTKIEWKLSSNTGWKTVAVSRSPVKHLRNPLVYFDWRHHGDCFINDTLIVQCHVEIRDMEGFQRKKLRRFDESMKDVTDIILIVEEEKFYVCKWFLAAQSSHFNTIFQQNPEHPRHAEIILDDIDAWHFQYYLEFLFGHPTLDEENVIIMMKLAEKYDSPTVMERCEDYLIINKREMNLLYQLELAIEFKLEKLKEECLSEMYSADDIRILVSDRIDELDHPVMTALFQKLISFY